MGGQSFFTHTAKKGNCHDGVAIEEAKGMGRPPIRSATMEVVTMGRGYFILAWDSFGEGLIMVNPRLYSEGVDRYGNPCNWWGCDDLDEDDVIEKHRLNDHEFSYNVIFT